MLLQNRPPSVVSRVAKNCFMTFGGAKIEFMITDINNDK